MTPTKILKKTELAHCLTSGDSPLAVLYVILDKPYQSANLTASLQCDAGEIILNKSVNYFGADTNNKKIPLTFVGYSGQQNPNKIWQYYATPDVDVDGYPCTNTAVVGAPHCATVCDEKSFVEFSIVCGNIQQLNLEPQEVNLPPAVHQEPSSPSWFRR
jgi:hypothetical protein